MSEKAQTRYEKVRSAGITLPSKENSPAAANLLYPRYVVEKQKKENGDYVLSGVNAIKLGVLTDNGMVYQMVGDPLELSLSDINPYPTRKGTRKVFVATSDTVKTIAESSQIIDNTASEIQIQSWFLRALNLQQRFEDIEGLVIKIEGEDFPATSQGLVQAWEKAGFATPEILINSGLYEPYASIHIPYRNRTSGNLIEVNV